MSRTSSNSLLSQSRSAVNGKVRVYEERTRGGGGHGDCLDPTVTGGDIIDDTLDTVSTAIH